MEKDNRVFTAAYGNANQTILTLIELVSFCNEQLKADYMRTAAESNALTDMRRGGILKLYDLTTEVPPGH